MLSRAYFCISYPSAATNFAQCCAPKTVPSVTPTVKVSNIGEGAASNIDFIRFDSDLTSISQKCIAIFGHSRLGSHWELLNRCTFFAIELNVESC